METLFGLLVFAASLSSASLIVENATFLFGNILRGKLPKYKLIIVLVHTAHVTGEEKESDRIMQKNA